MEGKGGRREKLWYVLQGTCIKSNLCYIIHQGESLLQGHTRTLEASLGIILRIDKGALNCRFEVVDSDVIQGLPHEKPPAIVPSSKALTPQTAPLESPPQQPAGQEWSFIWVFKDAAVIVKWMTWTLMPIKSYKVVISKLHMLQSHLQVCGGIVPMDVSETRKGWDLPIKFIVTSFVCMVWYCRSCRVRACQLTKYITA